MQCERNVPSDIGHSTNIPYRVILPRGLVRHMAKGYGMILHRGLMYHTEKQYGKLGKGVRPILLLEGAALTPLEKGIVLLIDVKLSAM